MQGDVVVVQPGTYRETIVVPTIQLSLALVAPGGPLVTVIDGSGLDGTVLRVSGSSQASILIEGFTVTGGTGTPDGLGHTQAGGMYTGGGDVTVRNCHIVGNRARTGGGVVGAPRMEACVIAGNEADDAGGGVHSIFWVNLAVLVDCDVRDNVAHDGDGGGLYGHIQLNGCRVTGNRAGGRGGGFHGPAGVGAAGWTDVLMSGNSAEIGGGCYLYSYSSNGTAAFVTNTVFRGNAATVWGGSVALEAFGCSAWTENRITNCAFIGNTTAGTSTSIWSSMCGANVTRIEGCTFLGETVAGQLAIDSCILRGVPAPVLKAYEVSWSNVQGGWPGIGNIDAEPGFIAAGDVHLLPSSPCRNAGNPALVVASGTLDLDGDPRVLEGRVDMGADEFADDCNANGVADWVDLAAGTSQDCGGDGVPDECQPFVDCNRNGQHDACDIAAGTSADCDADGVPDECQPLADCNGNGLFDACESGDCNGNGVPDVCDLFAGTSADSDGNGLPDECHGIILVPTDAPTLQAAVAAADPGDTVLIEPGVLSGPGNRDVLVDKSLLISGLTDAADCILDAGHAGRHVVIEGPVGVTLRRLTLRAGSGQGGGSLLAQAGAGLRVEDCTLAGNGFGQGHGGAIRTRGGAVLELVRSRLHGNAGGFGGAVCVEAGLASIDACTFSDNTADTFFSGGKGGTLRVHDSGHVTLRNSILRGGSAGAGDELQAEDPSSELHVAFCDVQGGLAGVAVTNAAALDWGPGNIDADPLFKDAPAGDFRLSGGSPCIDSGDPASAPDADGTPADMGAVPFSPFEDLGQALAGSGGAPQLRGAGTAIAGDPLSLTLAGAAAGAPSTWLLGTTLLLAPFKGGIMVPHPDLLIGPLVVAPDGCASLAGTWPAGLPAGLVIWLQVWIPDAGGPAGFAASNGLAVEAR